LWTFFGKLIMEYQVNAISLLAPESKIIMVQLLSILGCNKATAKKYFPHRRINIIPDLLNQDKKLMEIRLKKATITYVINNEGICSAGYLFLDDLSDLERYISICNKYFEIVTQNSWKYKNCCIKLLKKCDDSYFVISPLSPTFS